jgi:BASS family bile acid:Na+ symporter
MSRLTTASTHVSGWFNRHFLWLLVGVYALAAAWPAGGAWLGRIRVADFETFGRPFHVGLPSALLMALVLYGGLGLRIGRVAGLLRRPGCLIAGLVGNVAVPLMVVVGLAVGAAALDCSGRVGGLVAGLALIACVPVAASSIAWAHKADGDLALSLGLVVVSTCLSPLTTPLVLALIATVAAAGAEGVRGLADGGASAFLVAIVVVPTAAGVLARGAIGGGRIDRAKPSLSLAACLVMLLLNYCGASETLPRAVPGADPAVLALSLGVTVGLCGLGFGAGWVAARLLRADAARGRSLMFGLGMNNNGAGLVMASAMLPHLPDAALPIIVYMLVQHMMAGVADCWLASPRGEPGPARREARDSLSAAGDGQADPDPLPARPSHAAPVGCPCLAPVPASR